MRTSACRLLSRREFFGPPPNNNNPSVSPELLSPEARRFGNRLTWWRCDRAGFSARWCAQPAQQPSRYLVAMVGDEPVRCQPDPSQRRHTHRCRQPVPAWQHAQDSNPAEKAGVPLAIGRLHVHSLVKLREREGRFRRHVRVVIIAKLQPMIAVPARDRLLRPLAEWALAVVIDAELIRWSHLLIRASGAFLG